MSRSRRDVHVRIRRVVIDAAALGSLPREVLRAQLSAAIAQRIGGAPAQEGPTPLATRIGDAVAPTITHSLGPGHG